MNIEKIRKGDMIRLDSCNGTFLVTQVVHWPNGTGLESEFRINDSEGDVGWIVASDIIWHEARP